jgi:hypothetical protein
VSSPDWGLLAGQVLGHEVSPIAKSLSGTGPALANSMASRATRLPAALCRSATHRMLRGDTDTGPGVREFRQLVLIDLASPAASQIQCGVKGRLHVHEQVSV